MRRREFIAVLMGTCAWPLRARAQQRATPVVGFLGGGTSKGYARIIALIREGLGEAGYIEGTNLAIEYRWADGQFERLPDLAAELMRKSVAVIVTTGSNRPVFAAMAATRTIPIVFVTGGDPVQTGLVSKLSGSGGNVTGVTFFNNTLMPKRLEAIHEALPSAKVVALLMDSKSVLSEYDRKQLQAAAAASGVDLLTIYSTGDGGLELAFREIVRKRIQALLIYHDPVVYSRIRQVIALAAEHAVPAMYFNRECAELGGLMSYGPDGGFVSRQAGVYVGRILKGEKPADLPIQQPTKFELVINLKTAKALGLTVPPSLLARVDEVIE